MQLYSFSEVVILPIKSLQVEDRGYASPMRVLFSLADKRERGRMEVGDHGGAFTNAIH